MRVVMLAGRRVEWVVGRVGVRGVQIVGTVRPHGHRQRTDRVGGRCRALIGADRHLFEFGRRKFERTLGEEIVLAVQFADAGHGSQGVRRDEFSGIFRLLERVNEISGVDHGRRSFDHLSQFLLGVREIGPIDRSNR